MKRALFIISTALLFILPSRVCSQEMVDLGLPSGTKWKQCGEEDYYTKYDALVKYSYELPTETQIRELKNYCKWLWQDGRYKVIGPNGNYIFFEAKGYKEVYHTKVYRSTDDISKSASDRRDRGVHVSEENIAEVGRQGVYVYTPNGGSTTKLFKFNSYSFDLDYSFEDKSSYRGKYSHRVSVHLVNSDNRATIFSDNLFKQCERRGFPLSDISRLDYVSSRDVSNGAEHNIGYTDDKIYPAIYASVIKKNSQEGYWVCTWRYNFAFIYGEIKSNRIASYPSSTITIPRKIRLGDYEWIGDIASSYDYSRPQSYFSDKIAWVNRVQITPPENVTKISFEDGYINVALINLNYSSNVEEIHFPSSLRDFELFGLSSSDVLIFLPIKEPWEMIDGKRVPLFCGDECNTKFSEKCVFIVPDGSVEEYKKITRFKNARIYTSDEVEKLRKAVAAEKDAKLKREKEIQEERLKRQENERLKNEKHKQLILDNKHLYTPNELKTIESEYCSTSTIDYYWGQMSERKKIYDLINQHPELFPSNHYLEVITEAEKNPHRPLDIQLEEVNNVINKDKNFNSLIGEWKPEKGIGTKCVITSRNNQLYLTLKYKMFVEYDGRITDTNTSSTVVCSISADKILLNVYVLALKTTKKQIYHRITFENGVIVLYEYTNWKETEKIIFRKKESK